MAQRVVVLGAEGRLGSQIVHACRRAGDIVTPIARSGFDLENPNPSVVTEADPEVVINSAAWTDVDGCAADPGRARLLNGTAAGAIAVAAHSVRALMVQISTNEVFDGLAERPYREDDRPNPLNPYGDSKLLGEVEVERATPDHLIIRTAWLFGPSGSSFVTKIRQAAMVARREQRPLDVVSDEWGNPTWTPDLASSIVHAIKSSHRGILHLAGEPAASRFDWAAAALRGWGVELRSVESGSYSRASVAPRRAVLDTSLAAALGHRLIDWRPHLDEVPSPEGMVA